MTFPEKLMNYLKAAYPLLWIRTHEEKRILEDMHATFKDKDSVVLYEWDLVSELSRREKDGKLSKVTGGGTNLTEILQTAAKLGKKDERAVIVFKDFHSFIHVPISFRAIRNAIELLKGTGSMFVFLSPLVKIPPELEKDIQLLEFALPDDAAIKDQLEYVYRSVVKRKPGMVLPETIKGAAVDAAKGMTASEVQNAFTLAVVTHQSFNPEFVKTVFDEKIQTVKKNGLLTYIDPDVGFDQIGGLEFLKAWMKIRAKAFSSEARKYGLPWPKGALLCGIPGCGKSLIAKATAKEFGFPLFQLDVGALFGKHVGETEENFRRMVDTVDSIGRCVLYVDEIEKALNQDAVSGKGDTGTSSRSFGTLLSWMNDRKTPVFMIGTSNDHTRLPAEMTRKGRFDELFWIDLPSEDERIDIFNVLLKRYQRDPKIIKVKELAKRSNGFTGAEIENVIVSAMFNCFAADGKDIDSTALLDEIAQTIPLSKTRAADLERMRKEATGKLRVATDEGVVALSGENLRKVGL